MENQNLENWDADRYKELNTYFRIKIDHMLRTDPELQARLQEQANMQLSDLVNQFSEDDQERWEEFIRLDKQKMQVDMWNHLNGNGTRYQPGLGFTNPEDDTTW
ncbi:hypothetical protein [Pontibacter akesuensis]|uniref:Uncharacterized protein n=1 Tax=Pontibacter akesuensis TaxID=388950 RepID=A0A1I7FUD2_9BACT|nr:hypothetical protein [Pontibacter akesuensis]GHA60442.1 hypothetical protein GCM10007389_10860 [Pontibacter akesuensis]SFU39822.1 hypothetical protein SAMN04487941_0474 [Pontibacter akesuensis]